MHRKGSKPFFNEVFMKKNDRVIGVCSGYTHDGHGVVKIDGFPLFVKNVRA